jgi:hypothetical protein
MNNRTIQMVGLIRRAYEAHQRAYMTWRVGVEQRRARIFQVLEEYQVLLRDNKRKTKDDYEKMCQTWAEYERLRKEVDPTAFTDKTNIILAVESGLAMQGLPPPESPPEISSELSPDSYGRSE